MKILSKIFAFVILTTFIACQQDGNEQSTPEVGSGQVSFSFSNTSTSSNDGRIANEPTPDKIIISVRNTAGDLVYDREELDVIAFNGSYISNPISLEVGDYQLTEYFVLDASGTVIYITPVEGSTLDYLVADPLPIDFAISKDDSKQITPEVIAPGAYHASDFGYTDFDFEIVPTIDFLMSAHYFDKSNSSYELTGANVVIYGDGTQVFDKPIANVTTQIRVRDGFDNYTIVTSGAGYLTDTLTLTNSGLKTHQNDPIIVLLTEIEGYFYANNNLNNAYPANWTANKVSEGIDVVSGEPYKLQFDVSGSFHIACATWVARPDHSAPAIMELYLNNVLVGTKTVTASTSQQWIEMHGENRGEWTITASAGDIIELTVNGLWDGAGGNDYLEITQVSN